MRCDVSLLGLVLVVALLAPFRADEIGAVHGDRAGNEFGKTAKLMQINKTRRENKIAEIFIGVAYGGQDQQSIITPATTTTTTEITTAMYAATPTHNVTGAEASKDVVNKSGRSYEAKEMLLFPTKPRRPKYANDVRHTASASDANSRAKTSSNVEVSSAETTPAEQNGSGGCNNAENDSKRTCRPEILPNIQRHLGIAWTLHIYLMSAAFLGLWCVTVTCLLREIWRSWRTMQWNFILFYAILTLVCTFRCTVLIIDPYGVYHKIPHVVQSIMLTLVVPGLSFALSVFLSIFSNHAGISKILIPCWVIYAINVSLIVSLLAVEIFDHVLLKWILANIFRLIMLAVVAVWGLILCFIYVVFLSRIEKLRESNNSHGHATCDGKMSPALPKNSRKAAIAGTMAAFSQLFISGLIVYSLVGPQNLQDSSALLIWAWWLHHSLTRMLEIILSTCLLVAIWYISGDELKLFMNLPIFQACIRNKSSEIHPSVSSSRQALNVFTVHKSPDSSDYLTSDFQLVWNQGANQSKSGRYPEAGNIGRNTTSNACLKRRDTGLVNSRTLNYRYLDRNNSHESMHIYSTIKDTHQPRGGAQTHNQRVVVNDYKYLSGRRQGREKPSFCANTYRANPSPQPPIQSICAAGAAKRAHSRGLETDRTYVSLDQISENNTISRSDQPVDYLTDFSSSIDGLSTASETLSIMGAKRHPMHTLPTRAFTHIMSPSRIKRNSSAATNERLDTRTLIK